jgi:tetratricopeptide (TPR) repeat protein
MLRSAVASRRVGDIRQRLGQLDEAEREYAKAIEKLTALSGRPKGGEEVCVELARVYNELGNVRSARFESAPSYQCHRKAISILQSVEQKGGLSAEHRHELARTLYLLANKQIIELGDRRASDQAEDAAAPGPRHYNPRECRESAISILEQLTRENPNVPDYRFLLALCHRPPASDPTLATSSASARGRQRAIRILEELKMQYPEVDDYRYELIATYAWIHVGLFPWQRPSLVAPDAEKSLLTALEESQWLAAHNPSIPYYARSEALILAKLGAVYQGARRLAEAEDCFRRACRTLRVVLAGFPDLSAHHRVLLEFMRLRLAEVCYERNASAHDGAALRQSRDLLETCIQNLNQLAERPELAKDRLAWSSLPLAYDVLRRVLAETGENDKAEEAKKKGEAIARRMPDERKHKWWEY